MSRWVIWAMWLALSATLPGCLFVRHSTNVVRKDEPRRPVQFESESAKNIFQASVVKVQAHKEQANPHVVAIPFICWYSRVDVPSDNAVYNDQLAICDRNGDGLIALAEAQTFGEQVQQQILLAQAKEAGSSDNTGAGQPPPPPQPAPVSASVPPNVVR